MGAIEAVQATEELGFEAIGSPPEVDEILAQRLGREAVDGLADERIDCLGQTLSGIRYGERFHTEYYTKHLFAAHARTLSGPGQVSAIPGNNESILKSRGRPSTRPP